MSRSISIVCGTDENYAMPLGVMLFSAGYHLREGWDLHAFIVSDGLSDDSRRRLRRVAAASPAPMHLHFVSPDVVPEGLTLVGHLSLASYYRIFAPYVVPESVERAVYLDCDAIVLDDLARVWEAEMHGGGLLAVADYQHSTYGDLYAFNIEAAGIDAHRPYFNSGFLVMDLSYWRENRVAERALDFCRTTPPAIDQDGLNVALVDAWRQLPETWNVQMHYASRYLGLDDQTLQRRASRGDFSVLHYTGRFKPWTTLARGPAEGIFHRFLRRSGWFRPSEYAAWFMGSKARALQEAVARRIGTRLPAAGTPA